MKPRRAAMPPKDPTGDPVEIDVYLQYAQENIDRSRMLFKRGDLRYAVFSANEGLELFVKAHMLRYKIIDKAVVAGHYPYPVAVDKMIEIAQSSMVKNPANKRQLEHIFGQLCTLKDMFNMVKKLQMEIWKLSLNVDLSDNKKKEVEKLWKKFDECGKEIVQREDDEQRASKKGRDKLTPTEQDAFFAAILGTFREKTGDRRGSQTLPLPRNKRMPYSSALDMGRLFALVELIEHKRVIVSAFVHQQISRYPTPVDGVDSREVYMDHKDDVKALLKQIYATSRTLSEQLKYGDRFAMQSLVSISADMEKFMLP